MLAKLLGNRHRWPYGIGAIFLALTSTILLFSIQHPQAEEGGEYVCPLSETRENAAIKAFDELEKIFNDPRCLNCHGGLNPFAKNNPDHPTIDVRETLERFRERGLRKALLEALDISGSLRKDAKEQKKIAKSMESIETFLTSEETVSDIEQLRQKGKDQAFTELMFLSCEECHSTPPGDPKWRLPQRANAFTGKSKVDLCKHMKAEFTTGKEFLDHMDHDDFGDVSYAGTRALNENGIEAYVELRKKQFRPDNDKPTMKRDEVMKWATEWVQAIGDLWDKPPSDCGCKEHKYSLEVHPEWKVNFQQSAGRGKLESQVPVTLDLTFHEEGKFTGQSTVKRDYPAAGNFVGPATCVGSASGLETWKVEGKVDEETHTMHTKLMFDRFPAQGIGACTIPPLGTFTRPFFIQGFSSTSVKTPLDGFDMESRVGAKKHFEFVLPPAKNTVDVTIIEKSE